MYRHQSSEHEPIYTYQIRDTPRFEEKPSSVLLPLAVSIPTWDDTSGTNEPSGKHENYNGAHATQPDVPYLRWWMWEILAALLGVATLVAMAAVLRAYDGKPQDSWPSGILTINGLMAILTTICKGSFMTAVAAAISQSKWNRMSRSSAKLEDFATLDEASRGTSGSLQMLLKNWPLHIAYLGALITVLALGFETFLQQLISLRIELVPGGPDSPIGDVPRSQFFSTAVGYGNGWSPSSATRLGIYEGFMSNSIGHPPATCPSGNCTWPIIPTVGVCGACVDVTDDIVYNRSTTDYHCSLKVGNLEIPWAFCSSRMLDYMQIFTMGNGSGRVFESLADQQVSARSPVLIANFGGLGLPDSKSLTSGLDDARATDCALWYCLQTHNVSVEQGVLKDRVLKTWAKARVDFPGTAGGKIPFIDIPADMNVPSSDEYAVTNAQMIAMRDYAEKTFVGNASADGGLEYKEAFTDYADGLWRNIDNVNPWIERVARSMTNEIRMNATGGGSEARYRGTAYVGQVIIGISWGWIAFPATLVGLSLLYLLYEMLHTYRLNVRVWKADPLVPLCTKLEDDLVPLARQATDRPGGIKKAIGDRRMRLDIRERKLVGLMQDS